MIKPATKATNGQAEEPEQDEGIQLGRRDFYVSGSSFDLPPGRYTWKKLETILLPTDGRLGVNLTLTPHENPTTEHEQFYSMGSKAHESFQPNKSGKGVARVPGGPNPNPFEHTNWHALLLSLFNLGMPEGYVTNDLTVLEGLDAHMDLGNEPEERKGFRDRAEAGQKKGSGKVAVATEIFNPPWKGKKLAAPAPAKAAGKPVAVKKAAPPVEPDVDLEALIEPASAGIASVLETLPEGKGIMRINLRTSVHAYLEENYSTEIADQVVANFLESGTEDNVRSILGEQGFKFKDVHGVQIIRS